MQSPSRIKYFTPSLLAVKETMAHKRPLENCQGDINAKISRLTDGNVFDVTLSFLASLN